MSANNLDFAPKLTFVSVTGPTLDPVGARAMRAHTTRANFARRRLCLEREYTDQKEKRIARREPLRVEEDRQNLDHHRNIQTHLPTITHPGLGGKLNAKDAFYTDHLTQAMVKLHLVTNASPSHAVSALAQSDWARFLPDPTVLDASLFFARHVYAARLRHHAVDFALEAYKGRAIRSVRERLDNGNSGVGDSLIAAILILTVLDQVMGNVEAWKVHIAGLVQIITVQSRKSNEPPKPWILYSVPRTIFQGLLLFARHDATVLTTIENTDAFNTMLSAPAKKAAHLILANAEQVVAFQETYSGNRPPLTSEKIHLRRLVKSLDTAIELNGNARTGEAFLTSTALSIKIFLEIVLRGTTTTAEGRSGDATVRLMEVLELPEEQLCSSLVLCSSLEWRFWLTMMAVIAAPDIRVKSFYTSRLERILSALAVTSWQQASVTLQRFLWIPSVFAGPCYQALSEILHLQPRTGVRLDNHCGPTCDV